VAIEDAKPTNSGEIFSILNSLQSGNMKRFMNMSGRRLVAAKGLSEPNASLRSYTYPYLDF